jgi:hypothetical protein
MRIVFGLDIGLFQISKDPDLGGWSLLKGSLNLNDCEKGVKHR